MAVAPLLVATLLLALLPLRQGDAAGIGDADDLIAFCQPRARAAEPCFCSVETVEVPVTPGQFVLHLRERRAAAATSAAELRAAVRHAQAVCGEGEVAASLGALGASADAAALAPRGTSPVLRTRGGGTP